jgi:dimethylaniline monooxygenase (N-oxide forming)
MATGYDISFPFLSESILETTNNKIDLYKYMFIANMKHSHTLAIIGCGQTVGPLMPFSEIQARYYAQLMANKEKLPSFEIMNKDIQLKRYLNDKRFYSTNRHTVEVDYMTVMDELAELIGVKPNLTKYFFTDFKLWSALLFGPFLAYQFRLEGYSKCLYSI